MPSIISAADLQTANAAGQVYIIDLRAANDYDNGHIANAVNVTAGDILNHVDNTDLSGYQKIAVVCYSGQSAAWATSILRLHGYNNAYSLGFGMASWNLSCTGSWDNSIGNGYATYFEGNAETKPAEGDLPDLNTGYDTGEDILESRTNTILGEGFGTNAVAITAATVTQNLDNYYIVNYWPEGEYLNPGHLEGAYQYTPKGSLTLATDLKTLPTDKPIVVYCYTGQTSAYMAAYLRVLGYDAKTLLFGANGMIYDQMTKAKWTNPYDAQTPGYDLVTK